MTSYKVIIITQTYSKAAFNYFTTRDDMFKFTRDKGILCSFARIVGHFRFLARYQTVCNSIVLYTTILLLYITHFNEIYSN